MQRLKSALEHLIVQHAYRLIDPLIPLIYLLCIIHLLRFFFFLTVSGLKFTGQQSCAVQIT